MNADLRELVKDAIDSSASRCPRFYADASHPEPCDGLDGCDRCLGLAADSVLAVTAAAYLADMSAIHREAVLLNTGEWNEAGVRALGEILRRTSAVLAATGGAKVPA